MSTTFNPVSFVQVADRSKRRTHQLIYAPKYVKSYIQYSLILFLHNNSKALFAISWYVPRNIFICVCFHRATVPDSDDAEQPPDTGNECQEGAPQGHPRAR